jgi:hypothetical protein
MARLRRGSLPSLKSPRTVAFPVWTITSCHFQATGRRALNKATNPRILQGKRHRFRLHVANCNAAGFCSQRARCSRPKEHVVPNCFRSCTVR